jgi:hypothetical protein
MDAGKRSRRLITITGEGRQSQTNGCADRGSGWHNKNEYWCGRLCLDLPAALEPRPVILGVTFNRRWKDRRMRSAVPKPQISAMVSIGKEACSSLQRAASTRACSTNFAGVIPRIQACSSPMSGRPCRSARHMRRPPRPKYPDRPLCQSRSR